MNIYETAVVGNIDREDVEALAKLAKQSSRILEFGTGGSTQCFRQWAPLNAWIWSVDTDPKWQERTKENLHKLQADEDVTFLAYDGWREHFHDHAWFDLVFVDGLFERRMEFARRAWPLVQPGGMLCFHDCKWGEVAAMAYQLAAENFLEVISVQPRIYGSNIIAITRGVELPAPCPAPPPLEPWMTAHNMEAPPEWWPKKRG